MRTKLQSAESANIQLSRTITSLRKDLEIAQDKYSAQAGVIDMLRTELADTQLRMSKLQTHKQEMARKAASALKEVEAQVAALSGAVTQMKTQPTAQVQATPAPTQARTMRR